MKALEEGDELIVAEVSKMYKLLKFVKFEAIEELNMSISNNPSYEFKDQVKLWNICSTSGNLKMIDLFIDHFGITD